MNLAKFDELDVLIKGILFAETHNPTECYYFENASKIEWAHVWFAILILFHFAFFLLNRSATCVRCDKQISIRLRLFWRCPVKGTFNKIASMEMNNI